MKLNLKTLAVVSLCLGGAAAGSYLFYLDFTDAGSNGRGAPMAQVERYEERVKRKSASSFIWSNVQASQPLFRHESIQTGPGSSALVRFKDGSTLELKENSLVIIDDLKTLSANFLRGSLILHQDKGDSIISVDKEGKKKVEELAVQLITPVSGKEFFAAKASEAAVKFGWKARSEAASSASGPPLIAEVSAESDFRHFNRADQGALSLKAGHYFWRVVQGDQIVSTVARFSISSAEPLVPTWPTSQEAIDFYGQSATVELRWIEPESLQSTQASHQLEVAKNAEFTSIFTERGIQAKNHWARVAGLPAGKYFWRIRSKFGDLLVHSPAHEFETRIATQVTVELSSPAEEAVIPEGGSRFSWSDPTPDAVRDYLLEFSSGHDSESISRTEKIHSSTGITLPTLLPGPYRWRVKVLSGETVIGQSGWRKMAVEPGIPLRLKTPFKDQEIWHWEDPVAFKFTWSSDTLVEKDTSESLYQFEAASDPEFKQISGSFKTRNPTLHSTEVNLPEGHHYWRVKVLGKSGEILKSSEVSQFTFGVHPELTSPAAAEPRDLTHLNPLDLEADPVLSWAEVPGAEAYEITVKQVLKSAGSTRSPASEKLWIMKVIQQRTFKLTDAPEGTYLWSVRAVDRLKRSGEPMAQRQLILDAGETLESPKALSKEVQ